MFTPAQKESNKKVPAHEPLKMMIFGPCVEMRPRRLKLTFTKDPAKSASFKH